MLSKAGALVLVGYIAWLGWESLGPKKPEIDPLRKELADRVISNIVEDIRSSRDDIRRVALLPFGNDSMDQFTDMLRTVIEQSGVLDLRDRTLSEKARNVLASEHPSYTSTNAAVARGKELGTQGTLFGAIHAFESYPGGAKIDVEVTLVDVATGKSVFSKQYSLENGGSSPVVASVQASTQRFPWFQRLLGWLIVVLLLPVFTIGFIRTMIRRGSNRANFFVLSVYTVVDAVLAWLLVGAALNSWWAVLPFIVAVAAAFAYNVRIMTFALRLET
jgi:hypothetical protein